MMPSNTKLNPNSVKMSRGVGEVSWPDESLSSQHKHNRFGHPFGQPYLDTKCESSKNTTSTEKLAQSKSSENDRKPRPDDIELVKYMSNLPGFLQTMGKGSNVQEKALNFGVLDWKRLEKWKYTERMPAKYPQKESPSSKPRINSESRKQHSSNVSNPSSLHSGKQAMPHGSRFGSPQKQPPPFHSTHLGSIKEKGNDSYHNEGKNVDFIKSKGKEACNQEYQAAESIRTGRLQDHFRQSVKLYDETNLYNTKKKDPKKEIMSEKEASPSEQGKHKFSLSPQNTVIAKGKRIEMRFDEIKVTSESDPQNIVLLKPKNSHKSGLESSQSTELRMSLDGQLEELTGNRLSDFFSPQELKSGELSADIPHSCPLPLDSVTSIASDGKCLSPHVEICRTSYFAEASDIKQAERAPSPTRRFSFNLGRMSRSLSFKDNSVVPQLSSTYTSVKSGPAGPEVSSGKGNLRNDQTNAGGGRARSSPLRRLLDPLLKHKGAHSAETAVPLNGSLPSKGPPRDRKPEMASSLQALLQLTVKNGLPFFKFVVNNSNDMLAAAVKSSPTSRKSDSCMIYALYSVHEIKKKSMNWINQGSKSKSCSLGYNIIGQMKILSSSECDARECVLYGVDRGRVDEQTSVFVPNQEIAAIIVKNSSEMLNDADLSNKNRLYKESEFRRLVSGVQFEPEENKNSSGVTVILSGGVHGVPIKGAPSSLISRYRYGGSCDCGGWDVGCKLRILADNKKGSNSLQVPLSSSTIDHVNLFLEGGEQKRKPIFSLKPFSNGYYSIEFDASVSLLEAFATCVAYVTCLKFPEITDAKSLSGAQHVSEAIIGSDKTRAPYTFQEQLPAYVTCPPLSPVGRI